MWDLNGQRRAHSAWRLAGCDQDWIWGADSTPEPQLKDWMIESKTDSIQGSPGLRSHQGATGKCPKLGVEGA